MATRKQKIKVAIFLLGCATIMTIGTLVISGVYKQPGKHYWLEFEESILGLYEGGLVEYLGVPVGKVDDIFVTPGQKAHVTIVINPQKVSLREGVEGRLVIYSIAAGTMAVSLSGGDPNQPELPEYSKIPTRKSTIEAVSSQITKILEDVSDISETIRGQLAHLDEKAISDIVHQARSLLQKGDEFLNNSDKLVSETTETIKDMRKHAEKLVSQIESRSSDVERLVNKLETLVETFTKRGQELDMAALQDQLNVLLKQVTETAAQLDTTVANMEVIAGDVVHQTGNIEYALRSALLEISDSFESMRILLNQLKDDPSALIRGKGRPRE